MSIASRLYLLTGCIVQDDTWYSVSEAYHNSDVKNRMTFESFFWLVHGYCMED